MGCQQHLGGRLKFSLDTSLCAIFFCGVSNPGSTSASAPCSSLFQSGPLTMPISAAVLCFIELVSRILMRSILRDAVQANLFHRLNFVVAQAAGVASFIATAQQKFKHRTGYTQPLLIQHRPKPAG
jgi:hypothetical protein